jgi:hypothetical protein
MTAAVAATRTPKLVQVDSIEGTALCNPERDDDHFSYPFPALLMSVQLTRFGIFLPVRTTINDAGRFPASQAPKSHHLSAVAPPVPLTVRDAMLLGELFRRYHWRGDPCVPISLGEVARALGYESAGGHQRRLARASLDRLVSTTLRWEEVAKDGTRLVLTWHLVDETRMVGKGGRYAETGFVKLSQTSTELVEEGMLHYLNSDLCRQLVAVDEVAARLWMFLECESYTRPWHYSLFRSPPGRQRKTAASVIISEICGLSSSGERKRAAHRLRRAIDAIHTTDPGRYKLSLNHHSTDPGMYRLDVTKYARTPSANACNLANPHGTRNDAQGTDADA